MSHQPFQNVYEECSGSTFQRSDDNLGLGCNGRDTEFQRIEHEHGVDDLCRNRRASLDEPTKTVQSGCNQEGVTREVRWLVQLTYPEICANLASSCRNPRILSNKADVSASRFAGDMRG
jgi:hypothetical protein